MENEQTGSLIMTAAQLQAELLRCEYCEEKPCREACPATAHPPISSWRLASGNPSDIRRSAAEIMHANPLGGVCGMVCPDTLCMAACTRKKFDGAINIPLVQATIIEMAKHLGGIPEFSKPQLNGKKVAVDRRWTSRIGRSSCLGTDGLHGGYLRRPQPPGWDDEPDP